MGPRTLRAGMSGCGGIAPVTLTAAQRSPHFDVVAIQDPDPRRRAEMGDRFGIDRRHTTFRDLLTEDLDFVVLNGPNDVHAPQVEHAARAGVHCLVQKPMAPTLPMAEDMVETADRAGIRLGVLMLELGDPIHHEVKAMVEAGFFGVPTLVQATSAHTIYLDTPPEAHDWRRDSTRVGGGAFIQLAIHAIDLARWLLEDQVVSAWAGGTQRHTVFEDETTLATVRFAGGVVGHFAASYAADLYGFVLCGTEGRVHLLPDHVVVWGRRPFEGDLLGYTKPRTEVVIPRSKLKKAVVERMPDVEVHDVFARWVLQESDYPCPGDRGVEDMRIVDAAYRAVEEGRWIDLD